MSSALWIGTTGLSASNKQMDVIGNNLANANTIGFKAGETSFASMLSQSLSGGSGTMQVGQGVGVAAVTTQFAQGSFETTGNATDVAIDGAGFFIVKDKKEDLLYYTRAGSFYIDKNGDLSDLSGYLVQGHEIKSDGTEATEMTKINLTGRKSQPHKTEKFNIGLNLNVDTSPDSASNSFSSSQTIYDSAGSKHTLAVTFTRVSEVDGLWTVKAKVDEDGSVVIPDNEWLEFDAEGKLITDKTRHILAGEAVYTDNTKTTAITKDTSMVGTFYSSAGSETFAAGNTIDITGDHAAETYTVGATHTVKDLLKFIEETAYDTADVSATLVEGRIVVINKVSGAPMTLTIDSASDIFGTFSTSNPYGQIGGTDLEKRDAVFDFTSDGKNIGKEGKITWNRTSDDAPEITSYSLDSRVNYVSNDGYPAGLLSSIDVNKNGIIQGFFTNGQQQSLGRILTASFTNNGGLNKVGSYFMETSESGSATVGNPSEGGLGGLQSHALEISNTDVAKEFIKMIAAQRAYQSSSRIITSADEMLQELMNIKR
ncbi:MAG: flagellar hook-basal body complex protein [Syntrophobacterales bacterium]|nr:flagellar hook-basal body complex protein [Syntrophobacterales bacterium]